MNRFASSLLVAIAFASVALGQSATGSISGTVADTSGAMIPNVAVTARNVDTGSVRNTVSGSGGNFTIPLVPVGTYEVGAELAGFAAGRVANVVVAIGSDANVKLVLEPAGVQAAVTVSSEAPLIDPTKTAVSSVVTDRRRAEGVPRIIRAAAAGARR